MKNVSDKEFGLMKGALRRVFSRSDLRKNCIAASRIEHFDPERPRVKKWCRCTECKQPTAEYQMEADHINPIVPVTKRTHDMTIQELADGIFCDPSNLQAVCKECHKAKTKIENAERRKNFPRAKKVKSACAKP